MSDAGFYRLRRRLGLYSRFAGLGFIVLSIVFLVLSVADQFIVFEVDSVVAFIAAMFLLFRDPRARVQASVFDAFQLSSDEAIRELSGNLGSGFCYVPAGDKIGDVVLIPTRVAGNAIPNGTPNGAPSSPPTFTPPGRGLAELYSREEGLTKLTIEAIRVSLSDFLRESLELARSAAIEQEGDRVRVVLLRPLSRCTCSSLEGGEGGVVGCTISSFIAVLVSSATGRSVFLEGCSRDADTSTWTITMRLGSTAMVRA